MTKLCERCGKNPWVAPVFLGSKPTEQWCDDCIQAEIETKGFVNVLGNYFESKKQREVLELLDAYIAVDTRRSAGLPDIPDPELIRIRELLTEMWGE